MSSLSQSPRVSTVSQPFTPRTGSPHRVWSEFTSASPARPAASPPIMPTTVPITVPSSSVTERQPTSLAADRALTSPLSSSTMSAAEALAIIPRLTPRHPYRVSLTGHTLTTMPDGGITIRLQLQHLSIGRQLTAHITAHPPTAGESVLRALQAPSIYITDQLPPTTFTPAEVTNRFYYASHQADLSPIQALINPAYQQAKQWVMAKILVITVTGARDATHVWTSAMSAIDCLNQGDRLNVTSSDGTAITLTRTQEGLSLRADEERLAYTFTPQSIPGFLTRQTTMSGPFSFLQPQTSPPSLRSGLSPTDVLLTLARQRAQLQTVTAAMGRISAGNGADDGSFAWNMTIAAVLGLQPGDTFDVHASDGTNITFLYNGDHRLTLQVNDEHLEYTFTLALAMPRISCSEQTPADEFLAAARRSPIAKIKQIFRHLTTQFDPR